MSSFMSQVWSYWNNVISTLKQIEAIKDKKEKNKVATEFINNLIKEYNRDTNSLINSFLEIDSDVELIDVPRNLMDSLKESIFCYVNGQHLSTIATVGITAELFCVHLYRLYLERLGIERSVIKRRIELFSEINQYEKIDTLFAIVGINDHICQVLHQIRKIRNENVHPHADKNYKEDAIDSLQNIIDLLNLYSASVKQIEQETEDSEDRQETGDGEINSDSLDK